MCFGHPRVSWLSFNWLGEIFLAFSFVLGWLCRMDWGQGIGCVRMVDETWVSIIIFGESKPTDHLFFECAFGRQVWDAIMSSTDSSSGKGYWTRLSCNRLVWLGLVRVSNISIVTCIMVWCYLFYAWHELNWWWHGIKLMILLWLWLLFLILFVFMLLLSLGIFLVCLRVWFLFSLCSLLVCVYFFLGLFYVMYWVWGVLVGCFLSLWCVLFCALASDCKVLLLFCCIIYICVSFLKRKWIWLEIHSLGSFLWTRMLSFFLSFVWDLVLQIIFGTSILKEKPNKLLNK